MKSIDAGAIARPAAPDARVWRFVFAGLCASLVGIGLARFAYTPLIPPLIQAHWFSAQDVVYLGAANLAGYLVGALAGRRLATWLTATRTLRWMMVLVTAAFVACAFPVSVAWFFGWRFLSGVAGGAIMVLVAATLMPHIPAGRKGLAGGAIFLGLGLGIAGSGTLVPLLLGTGLRETWLGLGVMSGVVTAASWFAWPSAPAVPATVTGQLSAHLTAKPALALLYAEYALMAVGLIPGMVFFVDFIARGLGAGAQVGSRFWILYGVGAILGPPVYGLLADRWGARCGIRLALALQVLVVLGLVGMGNRILLGALTILLGTFPPGIVPLVLARVHEVLPHRAQEQNAAWGRATIVFAAAQAIAAYAYSALFNVSGGNHRMLFVIGSAALGLALVLDIVLSARSNRTNDAHIPPLQPVRTRQGALLRR